MSRCEECEKKKISMDRMATILSQQSNDWHKQRERIEELEEVGRELLIDAMNLYSHYPNNFRNDVKDYFEDEIKVFGLPEGAKE